MHYTEGLFYDDLGGGVRRHQNVPPRTRISKDIMNAMMMELLNTVIASGKTPAATGALDEAALWLQLANAIAERDTDHSNKILSCRWQNVPGGAPTDAGAAFDVQYVRSSLRKKMTIMIPNGGITLTGNSVLYLTQADGSALPTDWGTEMSTYPLAKVTVAAGNPEVSLVDVVGGGSPTILIQRIGGSSLFPIGAVTVWGTTLHYLSEDPMD